MRIALPLACRLALALALLGCGLATRARPTGPLEVERLELNVRIDPQGQALYVQSRLFLRNRGVEPLDTLELDFPAPLSPHVQVRAVWDRSGALPWRFDPVETEQPRTLLAEWRTPLAPGKKMDVVVSYDLNLEGLAPSGAAPSVTRESVRLLTTGWYPQPARSGPELPRSLRLTVRLPKEWQVEAPVKLKQLRDGPTLAHYELRLERVEPGQLLLRAVLEPPP